MDAVRPRTKDEIRAIAAHLRQELGAAKQSAIDLVSLIEFELPKLIPGFTLSVVKDDQFGSNILALTRDDPPEIVVRESVYNQAAKREPKARWIMAHELGHLILQHAKLGVRYRRQSLSEVELAEHQANVFAQYLLLPSDLVEQCSCPSEVAANFLVSYSAAEARFGEVRRKSHKSERSLDRESS